MAPYVRKPWLWIPAALLLSLGLAFALGEAMGWTFLVVPLQSQLQQSLGRTLRLQPRQTQPGPATGAAAATLHFWGGIRLQSPLLEIGAPNWSSAPHMLLAQDMDVRLRYVDVWRAWRGQQLVVQALSASHLTAYLERLADGRASWQFTPGRDAAPRPRVQTLDVAASELHYSDAPLALNLDAELALSSPTTPSLAAASSTSFASSASSEPLVPAPPATATVPAGRVLRGTAHGHFRKDAFALSLQSTGALPWEVDGSQGTPVAVKLSARVGRARLEFDGTAQDFLHLNGLSGSFRVQGPSLAAIGEPLGVTLPTTPAFQAQGQVQRSAARWTLALRQARVGASQLRGDFVFDSGTSPPRLTGTLQGTLLKLADLAPAVGAVAGAAGPQAKPGSALRARVLPTRPFDLAALRAMDADVQIALDQVDTNSQYLEPLRPFATHLQLTAGVLTLTDIDARTAQGHLSGTLALDGQQSTGHWVAALNWDGVQLQRWLQLKRAAGQPPFVTGLLQGHATLQGSGRSTAEILATLQGRIATTIERGTLSHLLVEMGGLDLAESLGVLVKGDNALVLDCALADLTVAAGILRPRLLVLDTRDSTVWMDGSVSLAAETLDLRAVVAPKDFSLLTLRAPLRIQGSLAHPGVTVEKGPLGVKLGSAVLLGLINPLAALLPLVDVGNQRAAQERAASCQAGLHQKLQSALPALRNAPR